MSDWNNRWDALRKVCQKRSLPIHNWRLSEEEQKKNPKPPAVISVEPPASEEEVAAIENEMGCSIPSSFRKVLREYSRKVDVCWMFPDGDEEYKKIYDGLFWDFCWGILYWSLEELPNLQKEFQKWLTGCYDDPTDSYGKHWYGKFPICEVGCGDYTVIEADKDDSQQVIYLSHDGDCDVNGFPMGKDFEDFVDRMSMLGCPSEGSTLYPFMNKPKPYLQVDGENARLWREWFGLAE